MKKQYDYSKPFNSNLLSSYGAMFNFVDTIRNTGKTSRFKARAFFKFKKHRRKTIWVRSFAEDVERLVTDKTGFYDAKICKREKIPRERISQKGCFIFYEYEDKNGKKHKDWFIRIVCLADSQALKGNEIETVSDIVFDEYTTNPERLAYYRGDFATDFFNLFTTIMRDHYVRCWFLGNKEILLNPFYEYFKIKPFPMNWQGIKVFRQGELAVQQINTLPSCIKQTKGNQATMRLFADTPYYDYLYGGAVSGMSHEAIKKLPKNAVYLFGFDFGRLLSVYVDEDKVFICSKADKNQIVYTNYSTIKYRYGYKITRKDVNTKMQWIKKAIRANKIFYTDENAVEGAQLFIRYVESK